MSNFTYHHRDDCRSCGSKSLTQFLDLGDQPPSNAFIVEAHRTDEQRFPLKVYLCQECGLCQLSDVVDSKIVFDEYHYLSSSSRALVEHYQEMVNQVLTLYTPTVGSLVVDVGANDGITLDQFKNRDYRLLGVEPSRVGQVAIQKGYQIESTFFNVETAQNIRNLHGPASIITATNVCAHVDDIKNFFNGFEVLLDRTGVLIIEFPYLIDMIERLYFDTIYHEHLCYFTLTPLHSLLEGVGLRAVKADRIELGASGPAIRLHIMKSSELPKVDSSISDLLSFEKEWGVKDIYRYTDFSDRVKNVIKRLQNEIMKEVKSGKRIGAFTAPAKGNTLLNAIGFDRNIIEAVAENNSWKVGKVTPGTHIPIITDEKFIDQKFDIALLLSWNYANFFFKSSDFIRAGGVFLVPLPEPHFLPPKGPRNDF